MKLPIQDCTNEDKEYLVEKLVDYNLSKVQAEQSELFIDLSRKIEKDGKIIAGIIARMYGGYVHNVNVTNINISAFILIQINISDITSFSLLWLVPNLQFVSHNFKKFVKGFTLLNLL